MRPSDPDSGGFAAFDLSPELLDALEDAGFDEPRPIQAEALPAALAGRDVLGLAQTGTGKTAAFVLPILERLLASKGRSPRALVVAPTRELASQVHTEFERLAVHTPLRSTPVFGGVPIPRQVRALARSPEVVVACPGRLLDLLGQKALTLSGVEVLVLDEADHMFDMGFLPDVRRILKALPAKRQNLLFSATMPPEIRKLADQVLHKPTVVELAHSRPASTIDHALLPLDELDKLGALECLFEGEDFTSAIVFLRTKRRAKQLANWLAERGHGAIALQGNMSQPQRERALAGFRDGTFQILVATDIAARGLDIEGVSHVINFDVPNTPDAYTHRIGRTGRSERTGRAVTFVTQEDDQAVRQIEKRVGKRIARQRLSELGPIERRNLRNVGKRKPGAAAPAAPASRSRGGSSASAGSSRRRGGGRRAEAAAPPARGRKGGAARPAAQVQDAPASRPEPSAPGPAFGAGIDGGAGRAQGGAAGGSVRGRRGGGAPSTQERPQSGEGERQGGGRRRRRGRGSRS